ncbi:EscU/YscU/HrcU family type III secretion system export apparatus switch protein [Bythopirellula polymerisocia]|uniref:Flagellar biosynthetic protein FlhB n=1 Tax=Bythopirellula polymerisocia TaxID=2528003 RepID=A0A5C6CXQ4_9BACT|nr:EscU/YscU/HrcU family type III secretion system export apparatus switch protein [Bythopirellula polymerisocia]TWU27816.1 Flagellar biosynthetic protein FlhB [Bythopirellula polymerisocia]
MAEQAGEKTQDATQHRRDEARKQGQVAYSQDLGSAALLIVGVLLIRYWGVGLAEMAGNFMRHQLGTVGPLAMQPADSIAHSQQVVDSWGESLLPILGLLAAAGVLSSIFQTGLLFVPDRLAPDIGRLNPLSGLKRILSLTGAVKLGFGMFKITIVSIVAATVVYQRHAQVLFSSGFDTGELAFFLIDILLSTALWVGVALFVLAMFDYAYQKWKHEQDLKMTHREVLDEMKNLQGDPQIIARRRAVQRQMALNRIGDKVPKADVVVTNPTELAVAIQYDPAEMRAPIVVAKGAGVIAQRIRRLALENNVPVVERKPLAQLLYKEVDINHPIPDQSYAAVAEVLAYVYQLKGKKMPTMPQAA